MSPTQPTVYFAPAAALDAPPLTDWFAYLEWRLKQPAERPIDRARQQRVARAMRCRQRRADRRRRRAARMSA